MTAARLAVRGRLCREIRFPARETIRRTPTKGLLEGRFHRFISFGL